MHRDVEDAEGLFKGGFGGDQLSVTSSRVPLEKPFDRCDRCIVFLTSLPGSGVGQLTPDVVESTRQSVYLCRELLARHGVGEGVQDPTEPRGGASARLGLDSASQVPLQRTALQHLDL